MSNDSFKSLLQCCKVGTIMLPIYRNLKRRLTSNTCNQLEPEPTRSSGLGVCSGPLCCPASLLWHFKWVWLKQYSPYWFLSVVLSTPRQSWSLMLHYQSIILHWLLILKPRILYYILGTIYLIQTLAKELTEEGNEYYEKVWESWD